jgi:hypothetical protein
MKMATVQLSDSELKLIVRQVVDALKNDLPAQFSKRIEVVVRVDKPREQGTPVAAPVVDLNAADARWGYPFGIDGLLSFERTVEFLGEISRAGLERLVEESKVRKGRMKAGGAVKFCARSVRSCACSLEG